MRAKWRKKRVRRLKRKRRKTRARRYDVSPLWLSLHLHLQPQLMVHVLTFVFLIASKHTTYSIYALRLSYASRRQHLIHLEQSHPPTWNEPTGSEEMSTERVRGTPRRSGGRDRSVSSSIRVDHGCSCIQHVVDDCQASPGRSGPPQHSNCVKKRMRIEKLSG